MFSVVPFLRLMTCFKNLQRKVFQLQSILKVIIYYDQGLAIKAFGVTVFCQMWIFDLSNLKIKVLHTDKQFKIATCDIS